MASLLKLRRRTHGLADGSYRRANGRRVTKDTPGAVRVELGRSQIWYGKYKGANCKFHRVPLCTNKTAAKQMLAKLVTDAKLAQHGLGDAFEEHRERPLKEHLADYSRELGARGNAPRYVRVVISRLAELVKGCGFLFLADLSASRMMDWLGKLRQTTGRPRDVLDAAKDWYTPREAASVLGIKPASVGTAVRRHRLEGSGHGRARRFPRATAEALQERLCQGASVETSNQYLAHVKSLCRWLVKDRRWPLNPLAHLEAGNAQVDRRHHRRELEADELRRLLTVTRASARDYRGLKGVDWYVLYATACGTEFRAGALAGLTPEVLDLRRGATHHHPGRSVQQEPNAEGAASRTRLGRLAACLPPR